MDMVTSSLCVAAISLGKRRNEEIMSPVVVAIRISDGPSKRTRQIMKKVMVDASSSTINGIQ